ncbi:MAG TPA: hypothetical protein ENJ91_06660 [Rhodobacteraceae bacterium]|nr:hypothetical protein [Paracoccaceae bacterium]
MRNGPITVALLLLSGCFGTPDLPSLSDVELDQNAPTSSIISDGKPEAQTLAEELKSVDTPAEVQALPKPEKPRRGLFALFSRRDKQDATPAEDTGLPAAKEPAPDAPASGQQEQIAAVAPEETEAMPKVRRGLFGPRRSKAAQASQIPPGTLLPFGEIAVACGVRGRALGKEVDRYPVRGKGYRLYDSNPGSTTPRTHYITGFKDGCPRQFTAGLALIGSPILHEYMRYDRSNKDLPFTEADKAYERIKGRVCGVSRGKPCSEKQAIALEKGMAFVTVYERFGGNARWEEILLHKGKIAASSMRTR